MKCVLCFASPWWPLWKTIIRNGRKRKCMCMKCVTWGHHDTVPGCETQFNGVIDLLLRGHRRARIWRRDQGLPLRPGKNDCFLLWRNEIRRKGRNRKKLRMNKGHRQSFGQGCRNSVNFDSRPFTPVVWKVWNLVGSQTYLCWDILSWNWLFLCSFLTFSLQLFLLCWYPELCQNKVKDI